VIESCLCVYVCVYVCVSASALILGYHIWDTGCRRPIGCHKSHVIFCKRATSRRALLQKMTFSDKASYDSTPPCMEVRYKPLLDPVF